MSTRNDSKPKRAQKGGQKKAKSSASLSSASRSVPAPVSIGKMVSYKEPRYQSLEKGAVRIRHREFLGDLSGSASDFAVKLFAPVNPANADLFPWLSAIATRYESYKFHRLTFLYESMVPTSQFGAVLMAIDYDATDPAPASKVQMMAYEGAQRGPVWLETKLTSTVANLQKIPLKFCLDHVPHTGQDIRLYNVGNLIIAMAGSLYTTVFGEIYVEYDVELRTPQLESPDDTVVLTYVNPAPTVGLFTSPTNYIQSPPASSESLYGFGTAAGIGAGVLSILKVGSYIWESWFATTDASAAATTPVSVTPTTAGSTVNSPNAYGTSGFQNGSQNATQLLLNVTEVPAYFTINATPAIGTTNVAANGRISLTRKGDL